VGVEQNQGPNSVALAGKEQRLEAIREVELRLVPVIDEPPADLDPRVADAMAG